MSSQAPGTSSAGRVAKGTVGLRMRITRFDARAKLSQNKAPEVAGRIIDELDQRNPELAAEMRRVREEAAGA